MADLRKAGKEADWDPHLGTDTTGLTGTPENSFTQEIRDPLSGNWEPFQ